MKKKHVDYSLIAGLSFTIVSALLIVALSFPFGTQERVQPFTYYLGIDAMGALACAGLFYGTMRDSGDGTGNFRKLIVLVSACFLVNELVIITLLLPEQSSLCFTFCLLSKLIDLIIIIYFYKYTQETLKYEGKFAKWVEIVIPVLFVLQTLFQLSNIFYPVTFFMDETGMYQETNLIRLEDVFFFVAAILTTILIIRSNNLRNQKIAALTFILLPLIENLLFGGFGNSGQYGMVLMSLIIMYCVIFNVKNRELLSTQTDLGIASKIQMGALPPAAPEFANHPNISLRCSMDTAKEVGGDFYDYFQIDDNRICFLIADVSGKGTPAALFMMTTKTMIKDYALTHDSTSDIFNAVNERLCENNDEGMFATAWIGILDTRTMTLQYTNAGHNYPIIQRRDDPCALMEKVHGVFLAGFDFTVYLHDEIQLEPGDRLLLYTDGVTEAHDKKGNLYGTDRLENVLERTRSSSGEQVLESILDDVSVFSTGVPQFDDITMVVLTIKE